MNVVLTGRQDKHSLAHIHTTQTNKERNKGTKTHACSFFFLRELEKQKKSKNKKMTKKKGKKGEEEEEEEEDYNVEDSEDDMDG